MPAPKRRRSGELEGKPTWARTTSSYSNIRTGTRQRYAPFAGTEPSRGTVNASQSLARSQNAPRRFPSNMSEASTRTFRADDDARSATATTENFHDRDADVDLEYLSEVIMAVHVTDRGAVGCTYYNARLRKLCFMEDVQAGATDVNETVKLFIDPTVILVSTKCNEEVIGQLDPEARNPRASDNGGSDQTRLPYLLECRPNSEFSYESGKTKLLNLQIGQRNGPSVTYVVPGDVVSALDHGDGLEDDSNGQQDALLRLSGVINMESHLTVGCAGAVLAYLQRRKATTFLPGDRAADAMFGVATVEMFSLSDSMFINVDTLLSLQITTTEFHPNIQQQGPASKNWSRGSKEGLSVYGLFHHHARTGQGRRVLRQIFLRPSLNLEVIDERHNTISAFLRPENAGIIDRLTKLLSGAKDVRISTVNIRKGITSGVNQIRPIATSVWASIRQFAFSALELTDAFDEAVGIEHLSIVRKVYQSFDKLRLAEVGALISNIVDFDMCRDAKRTVVLSGISDELDEARRTYEAIEDMLSQVAAHVAAQVPAELESKVNVIFFPQIGFLISIEHEEDSVPVPYQGPDPDDAWEKMFTSATHAYYKNSNTHELDERYGDIWGRVLDMEIEIIQDMAQRVLEHEDLLHAVSDICGEVDSLLALAKGAAEHHLVRPRMTEQNVIKIEDGRHILQELTVPVFVPNNTYLLGGCGDDEAADPRESLISADPRIRRPLPPDAPSVMILTGPNYSGKSIYLKQVAIIVYMAHIGSFVPARSATIGLTDAVLTRISTRETVSRIQSAFMNDLQQASLALNMATRRSLLIIDEFGKGTESYDGAGLAAGVFEHLLNRGAQCPKVIGATHFHEIFESGFLPPRPSLGFGYMEVQVQDDNSDCQPDEQITYLYNLRPGKNGSSYGTMCAAINGIDHKVINRADQLLGLAARGEDLVEACAQVPEDERKDLDRAEDIAREFLMLDSFQRPRVLLDELLSLTQAATTTGETNTAEM
ncbi:hypothetical protein CKM354_000336700 [Cercospora kikuchii]|uniref:DNA mismatch repair protein MSH5 n=1 Tax=Cercospora kikuchii TaxID=84275 RepID=A0A9P3CBP8_9PEZI|nr:uncharacterized protein CKM354_000336700 [Cercospora kikuchii]GIZ40009.1 hypothetical protein CKM354_000336700 [Cercospora kikuchii]